MPNMTLAIDAETSRLMRGHPEVNWSEVAREAFRRKGRELHMWDRILEGSTMTDQDAVAAGDEAKRAILRRLGW